MKPVILDFTEQDRAARVRAFRMGLAALCIAALFTASIVGPLLVREGGRITCTTCGWEVDCRLEYVPVCWSDLVDKDVKEEQL